MQHALSRTCSREHMFLKTHYSFDLVLQYSQDDHRFQETINIVI